MPGINPEISLTSMQFLHARSRHSNLILLGLALLFSFPGLAQTKRSVPNGDPMIRLVDSILQSEVDSGKIPGAVVQIKKSGRFYSKAYGFAQKYNYQHLLLNPPERMTTEHMFDIASLTKVVGTTTSIMLLVDKGLIHVDDPVCKYVPAFNTDEKKLITIRHLLTHTSGLYDWYPMYYLCKNRQDVFSLIARLPLKYKVGAERHYSDLGFTILGEIIERVSGMPLEQFVTQNIFVPLKMAHTTYNPLRSGKFPLIAATSHGNPFEHRMVYDSTLGFKVKEIDPTSWNGWRTYTLRGEVNDGNAWYANGGVSGAAGLFSTVGDIQKLVDMLMNKGKVGSKTFISQKTVDLFLTKDKFNNGLGWMMDSANSFMRHAPAGSFGHTGFTGTSIVVVPKSGISIILLINRQNIGLLPDQTYYNVGPIREQVFKAVYLQSRSIDNRQYHLRTGNQPEWKNFKGVPKKYLVLNFSSEQNISEQTLSLVQADVKQKWNVSLNGIELGSLQQDENRLVTYFPIPASSLKNGSNELRIQQADTANDDIYVGQIMLANQSLNNLLHESSIRISILNRNTSQLTPAHITIVNNMRALQPLSAEPNQLLAVRPGCIYTGDGKSSFSLPAGTYTIYAGRGFQYGVDSLKLVLKPGEAVEQKLQIEKEVPLEGWIASDTHIHTLTYSGHGDASMTERIITLAGEGIEFPIITEHNRCVNIDSLSRTLNLRQYFTPVVGDEYTTPVGHFNVFPLSPDSTIPDHHVKDWSEVVNNLGPANNGRAIILNHARDLHDNFRPFDSKRHLSEAGVELDGWPFPANAMEVLNSGAQQFDIMQLYRDWFGMLNHGIFLTPVGSSDSHDVCRYLVGQGRTYIRCSGKDAGDVDRSEVIRNFLNGEVMVSFGLVAELKVNGNYLSGSIVPAKGEITVEIKVMAPSWAEADSVFLFANGKKIRSARIVAKGAKGIKWQGKWTIPVSNRDMFLVAIATGPDPHRPFWTIPNPYQPTSPVWNPKLIGSSGAIWIDGDRDGKRTGAYTYARWE